MRGDGPVVGAEVGGRGGASGIREDGVGTADRGEVCAEGGGVTVCCGHGKRDGVARGKGEVASLGGESVFGGWVVGVGGTLEGWDILIYC